MSYTHLTLPCIFTLHRHMYYYYSVETMVLEKWSFRVNAYMRHHACEIQPLTHLWMKKEKAESSGTKIKHTFTSLTFLREHLLGPEGVIC